MNNIVKDREHGRNDHANNENYGIIEVKTEMLLWEKMTFTGYTLEYGLFVDILPRKQHKEKGIDTIVG